MPEKSGIAEGRVGLTEARVNRVAAAQREAARLDHDARIALEGNATTGHHEFLVRALKNVLATKLALFMFAQDLNHYSNKHSSRKSSHCGQKSLQPLQSRLASTSSVAYWLSPMTKGQTIMGREPPDGICGIGITCTELDVRLGLLESSPGLRSRYIWL